MIWADWTDLYCVRSKGWSRAPRALRLSVGLARSTCLSVVLLETARTEDGRLTGDGLGMVVSLFAMGGAGG